MSPQSSQRQVTVSAGSGGSLVCADEGTAGDDTPRRRPEFGGARSSASDEDEELLRMPGESENVGEGECRTRTISMTAVSL